MRQGTDCDNETNTAREVNTLLAKHKPGGGGGDSSTSSGYEAVKGTASDPSSVPGTGGFTKESEQREWKGTENFMSNYCT